jgi:hypothetical protein
MKSLHKSETHPIITLRPSKSNIKNDEGKYLFVGKVYGTSNINKDLLKVYEFLENFTLVNENELLIADNGIYNWIMYSNDDSDNIKFIATQIISPYELGTTHHSIACNKKINASLIYGAGELKKEDNKIIFNLLSGTYTKKIPDFYYKEIINKFIEFFPDSTYDNTRDSYVYKVKTVSNKLLELYKELGYTVRLFELSNDCVEFNNKFWNIDWNIEYYSKKIDNQEDNLSITRQLYIEALESMIKLLEN